MMDIAPVRPFNSLCPRKLMFDMHHRFCVYRVVWVRYSANGGDRQLNSTFTGPLQLLASASTPSEIHQRDINRTEPRKMQQVSLAKAPIVAVLSKTSWRRPAPRQPARQPAVQGTGPHSSLQQDGFCFPSASPTGASARRVHQLV